MFNDRGEVEIMARVTARIMPGVVGMPHAHRREVVDGVTSVPTPPP
ncbi:MAG: molybdopterin dinucleotide binding domain-containing protein [Coriobacteriaceae bacterium]